ncbi:MAG: hypothetical protein M0001_02360 [Treponema sp.]|nr:hypothetical protein [Treponema sp.]
MRTTVEYRDDLMVELQARAARDKLSLKDEVNVCLERALGLGTRAEEVFSVAEHHLGGAALAAGSVWELVDSLEAEAYVAKRDLGK